MNLGKMIKKRRLDLGLTQESLANKSGVSLATIQNIEVQNANPSINLLYQILNPLNLEINIEEKEVDWDYLSYFGLPLTTAKSKTKYSFSLEVFLDKIKQANLACENFNANPRKIDALNALLFSLKNHYPNIYKKIGNVKSKKFNLNSGRMIKLSRIARSRLGEII